jgi:paraquat-inducible protein A
VTQSISTAMGRGLYSCPACYVVSRARRGLSGARCPRCGAALHFRKPDSISRTWALLIAGFVLYLPANILPIMETNSLFDSQVDTILSGIIYLWTTGSWFIAVVVFIASILVPLAKLATLMLLLVTTQSRSTWRPMLRGQMYRVIEFIGRWSMLDIYVLALLVALVQMKTVANIKAGPGAVAFGAMVVVTMLASLSFDPRLIWDACEADGRKSAGQRGDTGPEGGNG